MEAKSQGELMPLEKEPFVSYTVDAERTEAKRDIFSVSLNAKERAILNRFKQESNVPHDSKALKLLAMVGANVINATIGTQVMRYLSSQDRTKIID